MTLLPLSYNHTSAIESALTTMAKYVARIGEELQYNKTKQNTIDSN